MLKAPIPTDPGSVSLGSNGVRQAVGGTPVALTIKFQVTVAQNAIELPLASDPGNAISVGLGSLRETSGSKGYLAPVVLLQSVKAAFAPYFHQQNAPRSVHPSRWSHHGIAGDSLF